ncbi:MAG: hypothetical protein KIT33_10420 [Candidatus Kapabacteria bacterium]|nr:hypothetical protein [Ignavibacteriota bacterium]MCW5885373.1 hypothetical protein [Candidatus Kapabacteria bacterium]
MSYDIPEYQQITDMKEATKVSKGYYRFEVSSDIDLMSWYEYRSYCKSHGRINEKYFNALENFLYDNESYYDVLFSLKTIYKDKWLNIEVRDVETSNWKRLTTNDVLNIMTMKEVKLTGLKIINPSMEILDIYNN